MKKQTPPNVIEFDTKFGDTTKRKTKREADEVSADIDDTDDIKCVDLRTLIKHAPEPPRFVLPGWLPVGVVTLLAGHGSTGKSSIALHLAATLTTGNHWCGAAPERPLRVLVWSCEDSIDVVHWRLVRICEALRVKPAAVIKNLVLVDGTSRGNILFESGYETEVFERLMDLVREEAIDVVILDNASHLFAGSEIARAEVTAFIGCLTRLTKHSDLGAVLLLAHVNRAASQSRERGQQYSGSTAWHNAVRSRLELTLDRVDAVDHDDEYARSMKVEEGEPRTLAVVKMNAGRPADPVTWRYAEHALLPDAKKTPAMIEAEREGDKRQLIEAVICATDTQNEPVRDSTRGEKNARAILQRTKKLSRRLYSGSVQMILGELDALVKDGLLEKYEIVGGSRRKMTGYKATQAGRDLIALPPSAPAPAKAKKY